ncbi:MAG TPA: phenylacetate--CoA ligase, partial [Spirochaetia bacterium]
SNYLIEIHEENFMDKLHVSVELSADAFQGTLPTLEKLQGRVLTALKEETGVTPVVRLLEAGSLPAGEGKAVRVVDKRTQSGRGC